MELMVNKQRALLKGKGSIHINRGKGLKKKKGKRRRVIESGIQKKERINWEKIRGRASVPRQLAIIGCGTRKDSLRIKFSIAGCFIRQNVEIGMSGRHE